MKYVYKKTEPSLWTVGHYNPDGTWWPESDHGSPEEAGERVHYLNGGSNLDEFTDKQHVGALVDELGHKHGFGKIMTLARDLWDLKLGGLGGALEVGPARGLTTDCGCEKPHNCEWCCGTGWLTERVKEVKDQMAEMNEKPRVGNTPRPDPPKPGSVVSGPFKTKGGGK